jgi:hypothetical protein
VSPAPQEVAAHGQQQPPPVSNGGLFSNLRRQFGKGDRTPSPLPPPPSLTPVSGNGGSDQAAQRPAVGTPTQSHQPASTPTSMDAIRANLTRAIQASRAYLVRCFSEADDVLFNRRPDPKAARTFPTQSSKARSTRLRRAGRTATLLLLRTSHSSPRLEGCGSLPVVKYRIREYRNSKLFVPTSS